MVISFFIFFVKSIICINNNNTVCIHKYYHLSIHFVDVELRLDCYGRPVKLNGEQLDVSVIKGIRVPSANQQFTLSDSDNSITSQLLAEAPSYSG